MTAIAAIVEDGVVWMGGDAAGVGGYSISYRSDPKVFLNGEFLIGYTTSFRMGQLLQYDFTPPTPNENEVGIEYMVRRFIPAIQQCFRSGGWDREEEGRKVGGTFLVGWRGQLYQIQSDFQVGRTLYPFDAVGCGEDLLLGSLHTTDHYQMTPEERLTIALDAASTFSAGVAKPYTILHT